MDKNPIIDLLATRMAAKMATLENTEDRIKLIEKFSKVLKDKRFHEARLSRGAFAEMCEECGGHVMEYCEVDNEGIINRKTCTWYCRGVGPSCDFLNNVYLSR